MQNFTSKKIATLLLLIITATVPTKLFAQELLNVSGVVLDEIGEEMVGVRIMEQGNLNNIVLSDVYGNFSINAAKNSTLVFSFIGYTEQEVKVINTKPLTINMDLDVRVIDEVVVVGYATMKRSDLTGATSSIKADDLMSAHSPSLADAMRGKAPGLSVSTTSAAPGGSLSIRIRGTNSLLSDSSPLYVVDGFPTDDISSLNTNDIASVEVLKDASSTAIYGSRGANGVILIETHKGNKSAPTFNFSSMMGVQEVYRKVEMLNGEQFAELYNEYCVNTGAEIYYDGSSRQRPLPSSIGEGTDWFDQIIQLGLIHSYDLSLSGGTDRTKYRIAGGYYGNKGVILGGDHSTLRLNATNSINVTNWMDVNIGLFLIRNETNGSGDRTGLETKGGTLNNALKMSPTINVYDSYGNYNANYFPGAQGTENPVAYANESLDNMINDNVTANLNLNFKPFDGLRLQVKAGANFKQRTSRAYLSTNTIEGAKINGQASLGEQSYQTFINEYVANYDKKFGKHSFLLTGAFSLESYDTEFMQITGTGLTVDDLSYAGIASADIVEQPLFTKYSSSLMSGLLRLNYNYDNRYLLTVTSRLDGNSGFADGHKWGNFPSVAAAWRISNEKFMSDIKAINDLKLRLSYGITGNSKIGTYRSLGLLGNQRYPIDGQIESGMGPSTIANPNLTWERTTMYNAGFDLQMFKRRLTLSFDAYYKLTSDMLMSYDVPTTSGFSQAYINAGELENKGLEVALSGIALSTKDMELEFNGSLSMNRDKVLELYGGEPLVIDIGDNQAIWIREGRPIREFQSYEVAGIFSSQEEIDNYTWVNPETGATKKIQGTAQPGDIKYVDVNNDGTIDTDDYISYGSALPDFTYSLGCNFRYKNFSVGVFLTGSQGNIIQNRNLAYTRNTTIIRNNMSADLLDRWTPQNTDATVPRIGSSTSLPTFEDGSYLRIQNVNFTYSLPKNAIKGIKNLSLTAGIDNLYVWTEYSGWDPDVSSAYGGSENVNIGQDVNSYPRPRIYRLSATITF